MKKKVIYTVLIVLMCVCSFGFTFAWSVQPNNSIAMPSGTQGFIGNILGALQGAGMIVGVFILVFFGFKYLTAGAGEKAKTKEMLVPFIIGAAVIMLAPVLANWIFGLTSASTTGGSGGTGSGAGPTNPMHNSMINPNFSATQIP